MVTLDTIVAFAKRRGFVYPTSEIYGGLANSYDYGPYGSELIKNIRDLWWTTFVRRRPDMVGIDSQIIQHPTTWVASGHVGSFSDPLVEDKKTHKRYRADHLIEEWLQKNKRPKDEGVVVVENMKIDEMAQFITDNKITSPDGNELTEPKPFNLLFETELGTVSGDKSKVYLRGETAQGIFANFKQILDSCRVKLPFGVGQIGKSFRNEITQGQFVFRTFEFEQAEIEYFFDPEQTEWQVLMDEWKEQMFKFVTGTLGISEENLRWRQHTDKERSHYSKDTYDLDYHFPFGWKELWGLAYRTDFDLKAHMQHSGKSLEYVDSATGRKFVPHVIEPAVGVNRLFLMTLVDAYAEEDLGEGKKRTVLRLNPSVAPVKVAIFPLQKDEKLRAFAQSIYQNIAKSVSAEFDDAGNIGKMYRRQDEIGTPFCVTVDYDSIESESVTVRERDSMKQERVSTNELLPYIMSKIT
ncbi:glycine--tRNA ligase [Candidatus Woesebacteria bacterium]|nr:glycine--tRNA ligase [Candidatus Woesebacteria bacterium]